MTSFFWKMLRNNKGCTNQTLLLWRPRAWWGVEPALASRTNVRRGEAGMRRKDRMGGKFTEPSSAWGPENGTLHGLPINP